MQREGACESFDKKEAISEGRKKGKGKNKTRTMNSNSYKQ